MVTCYHSMSICLRGSPDPAPGPRVQPPGIPTDQDPGVPGGHLPPDQDLQCYHDKNLIINDHDNDDDNMDDYDMNDSEESMMTIPG